MKRPTKRLFKYKFSVNTVQIMLSSALDPRKGGYMKTDLKAWWSIAMDFMTNNYKMSVMILSECWENLSGHNELIEKDKEEYQITMSFPCEPSDENLVP